MKNLIYAIVLTVALATGCAKIEMSGVKATTTMNISTGFTKIQVEGPIDVISSVEYDMAVITADSNVLPYVEIVEKGNTLIIRYEKGVNFHNGPIGTTVCIPAVSIVRAVSISGASSFTTDVAFSLDAPITLEASGASDFRFSTIASSDVMLELSGASYFSGKLLASNLSLIVSGASSFKATGYANNCNADISGASYLGSDDSYEYSFRIDNFTGTLSGASSAFFYSDGSVAGSLSGASALYYSGGASNNVVTSGGSFVYRN